MYILVVLIYFFLYLLYPRSGDFVLKVVACSFVLVYTGGLDVIDRGRKVATAVPEGHERCRALPRAVAQDTGKLRLIGLEPEPRRGRTGSQRLLRGWD